MQPDTQKIFDTVYGIARRELEWSGDLKPSTRLIEDLELDSIRLMTLAMAVEDHFSICLDEDDESSILTLGDLVAIIERKQSPSSSALANA